MTPAQRRNRLTTHFSERIPVVNRRISVNTKVSQRNSPCSADPMLSDYHLLPGLKQDLDSHIGKKMRRNLRSRRDADFNHREPYDKWLSCERDCAKEVRQERRKLKMSLLAVKLTAQNLRNLTF